MSSTHHRAGQYGNASYIPASLLVYGTSAPQRPHACDSAGARQPPRAVEAAGARRPKVGGFLSPAVLCCHACGCGPSCRCLGADLDLRIYRCDAGAPPSAGVYGVVGPPGGGSVRRRGVACGGGAGVELKKNSISMRPLEWAGAPYDQALNNLPMNTNKTAGMRRVVQSPALAMGPVGVYHRRGILPADNPLKAKKVLATGTTGVSIR